MELYGNLVRHVLHPLALCRRGEWAERRYLREFESTQFLPQEELHQLQWRRLRSLLQHAHDRCPFYRRRFAELGLRPEDVRSPAELRLLPALEKRDIQEQGADMVARGWPAGDLIRNQT